MSLLYPNQMVAALCAAALPEYEEWRRTNPSAGSEPPVFFVNPYDFDAIQREKVASALEQLEPLICTVFGRRIVVSEDAPRLLQHK